MQKNLNKSLLGDLIIGNVDQTMDQEILETEEVKSMMYHQWKNPGEMQVSSKPDLKKIFAGIAGKTRLNDEENKNSRYLHTEIKNLKTQYHSLKRRYTISLSIAASVILFLSVATFYIVDRNKVFQKTYTENITPKGQKSQVLLPDGTRVFLNSGSVIRYDNRFGKTYRELSLSGEAYFEVVHNKKLPFLIKTKDVEVRVIGTKFNVLAYPEDETVETVVSEGRVSVTELYRNASLTVGQNQKATYHRSTKLLSMDNVKASLYSDWKENILTFDNENFPDMIKKLERWYDVDISVQGTDSITDRFTMTIKSESLREVLELISLTTNIEYTIHDNKVSILYN